MAEVWSEASPGERRHVTLEASHIVEIRLERTLEPLRLGTSHTARVRAHGLVEVAGREAHINPVPILPEGTALIVEVIREPMPEPGRLKAARVRQVTSAAHIPSASRAFNQKPIDIEELLDAAITGLWPITGGLLSAERTRAGLVIDVDGTGNPQTINLAAAAEIARRLRLYGVGGAVMVDFIGMDNRAARLAVAAAFDAASAADSRPFERTLINGYGLMQIIRPRPTPSVIDTLCGTRRQHASDETLALSLLREAARSQGAGFRQLTARPAVAALIRGWPELIAETEQHMGAALHIVADPDISHAGHVHVMPL